MLTIIKVPDGKLTTGGRGFWIHRNAVLAVEVIDVRRYADSPAFAPEWFLAFDSEDEHWATKLVSLPAGEWYCPDLFVSLQEAERELRIRQRKDADWHREKLVELTAVGDCGPVG